MSENFKLEKMYINKIVNKINNIQNQFNLLSSLNQVGGNDSLKKAYISKITKKLENIIKSSKLLNNFNKVIYQFGGASVQNQEASDPELKRLQDLLSKKNVRLEDAKEVNFKNEGVTEVQKGPEFKAVHMDIEALNQELQNLILNLRKSMEELETNLTTKASEISSLNDKIKILESETKDCSALEALLAAKTLEYDNLNKQMSDLQQKLTTSNELNESLKQQLESKETDIKNKDAEIAKITSELQGKDLEIVKLNQTIEQLKEELKGKHDLTEILKQVEEYHNELLKCQNKDKRPTTQTILDINSVNTNLRSKYDEYSRFNVEKKPIQVWSQGNDPKFAGTMKSIYEIAQPKIDSRYQQIETKLAKAKGDLSGLSEDKKQIIESELTTIKDHLRQIKTNASSYQLTQEQKTLGWTNSNETIDVDHVLSNPVIYSSTFKSGDDDTLISEISSEYNKIIESKNSTLKEISTEFEAIKSEYSKLNADIESFNDYITHGDLLQESNQSEWVNRIKTHGAGAILE